MRIGTCCMYVLADHQITRKNERACGAESYALVPSFDWDTGYGMRLRPSTARQKRDFASQQRPVFRRDHTSIGAKKLMLICISLHQLRP